MRNRPILAGTLPGTLPVYLSAVVGQLSQRVTMLIGRLRRDACAKIMILHRGGGRILYWRFQILVLNTTVSIRRPAAANATHHR